MIIKAERRACRAPEERFLAKVDKTETCWLWHGASKASGYGVMRIGPASAGMVYVHRFSYELYVGPIPDGLQIDHLCRVRNCVNPSHLEPVTLQVNVMRSDHPIAIRRRTGLCKWGHPITPDNTYLRADGTTECLPCRRERAREYWRRAKAA